MPRNRQLVGLLTAAELINLLGIDQQSLPRGVREVSPQFKQHQSVKENLKGMKSQIVAHDDRRKAIQYSRLKCIRTQNGQKIKNKGRQSQPEERVLTVKLSSFYQNVRCSLMDENINLVPIVSIVPRKGKGRHQKEDFRSVHVFE